MSIQSEINRIAAARETIRTAIQQKGVVVATSVKLEGLASKVAEIETPDATIYTGSADPSASLGSNGDLYLKI